jgi:hypothetical protein
MSDPTDDPTFLASVYLDDEASRDERALVETSPEALGEVERLARVRTVLGATVEPVSLAEREAHLAAALDVWERMTDGDGTGEVTPASGLDAAAGAALTTPRSSSSGARGRRGSSRSGWTSSTWLLGAAAALVVLAGVGAVLSRGGTSNDSASEASESTSTDVSTGQAPTAAAEPNSAEVADDALTADQAEAEFAAEGSAAARETEETDSTDAAAGDVGEVPPVNSIPAAPASEADLVQLNTLDELAAFAGPAITALEAGSVSAEDRDLEPEPGSCENALDIELIVDAAFYQETRVLVGIDEQQRIAFAYTDDCSIVAQTRLDR